MVWKGGKAVARRIAIISGRLLLGLVAGCLAWYVTAVAFRLLGWLD